MSTESHETDDTPTMVYGRPDDRDAPGRVGRLPGRYDLTDAEVFLLRLLREVHDAFVALAPPQPSQPEDVEDAARHVRALQRFVFQSAMHRVDASIVAFGGHDVTPPDPELDQWAADRLRVDALSLADVGGDPIRIGPGEMAAILGDGTTSRPTLRARVARWIAR